MKVITRRKLLRQSSKFLAASSAAFYATPALYGRVAGAGWFRRLDGCRHRRNNPDSAADILA